MPKRPLVGFDQLSLLPAAVHGLLFTIPPACPDQSRSFVTGQPTVPRRSLWRQRYPHGAVVEVLLGVMVDRRAEGLKIGASPAGLSAGASLGAAPGRSDRGQHLPAPIIVEPADGPFQLR